MSRRLTDKGLKVRSPLLNFDKEIKKAYMIIYAGRMKSAKSIVSK